MWRSQSVHARGETETLKEVILRLEKNVDLTKRVDALLHAAAASEPLIAQSLQTPQSPPYHAEGPAMRAHLFLILLCVYGLVEEEWHLIDVEEFRRLRGYEGEIDEMEEMIKENVSLFEVFALCHDAGKWPTFLTSALEGSRGGEMGFGSALPDHWHLDSVECAARRKKYQELFAEFCARQGSEVTKEAEVAFFEAYGIRCRYPNHEHILFTPVYHDLVKRVAGAHRLPSRDAELVIDLVSQHQAPLKDFGTVQASRIAKYIRYAQDRGYDADDFLDLLQAALFLDIVCGSKRYDPGKGYWHETDLIVNFLRSEHDFAPWKRAQKVQEREREEQSRRQRVMREVGLDGVALMELLGMDPGPEFGRVLRSVHAWVADEGPLPAVRPEVKTELDRRSAAFYESYFGEEV